MEEETKTPAPETSPAPEVQKTGEEKSGPPQPTWLFYVLSIIIPLAGIILGIIYMTKKEEGEEVKKFGKTCLTLGIIFSLLPCICWAIMMGL
ncbi:hypothetical protein KKC60_05745, partial [Patescibacteria group bacterium]|nr:hypothetical protein [Patescibacteria group bacterium]